jgi:Flp pilus assembly pilin Flp
MRRVIARFAADEQGSAAIEYSLILASIALGILAVLLSFGGELQQIYAGIAAGLNTLSDF